MFKTTLSLHQLFGISNDHLDKNQEDKFKKNMKNPLKLGIYVSNMTLSLTCQHHTRYINNYVRSKPRPFRSGFEIFVRYLGTIFDW